MNKRTEFETTLLQKPDIICVIEYAPKRHTMLKVQDSELHVDGYDLCTNVNRCKRGVLIYTATYLKANPCGFACDFDENVRVGLKLRNKDNLLIGCLYRSPNSDMRNSL